MLSNFRAFCDRSKSRRVSRQAAAFALLGMISAATLAPQRTVADEGGVSFWLPGIYGSQDRAFGEDRQLLIHAISPSGFSSAGIADGSASPV